MDDPMAQDDSSSSNSGSNGSRRMHDTGKSLYEMEGRSANGGSAYKMKHCFMEVGHFERLDNSLQSFSCALGQADMRPQYGAKAA